MAFFSSLFESRSRVWKASLRIKPGTCYPDRHLVGLDLLSAPTSIGIPGCEVSLCFHSYSSVHVISPHIRRWLNRWGELQRNVANADQYDQPTGHVFVPEVSHRHAAHEDVN